MKVEHRGMLFHGAEVAAAAAVAGAAAGVAAWLAGPGWGAPAAALAAAAGAGGFLACRAGSGRRRARALAAAAGEAEVQGRLLEGVAPALEEFAKAHDVFQGQLAGVTEQTEQAAVDIVNRLDELDRSMKDLLDYLSESIQSADRVARELAERQKADRQALERMHAYVEQRKKELELDWARVQNVLQRSRELLELTELVREVATQTNLLALNARIEAARAGNAGRGFAVVADEVRKLSVRSERAADRIERGIQEMISTIEQEFSDKLDEAEQTRQRDMLVEVDGQLAGMGAAEERCALLHQDALRVIEERSRRVAELVMDTLAQIQFQDVTRQRVEQVARTLEEIAGHATRLAEAVRRRDPDAMPADAFRADAMKEAYVMEAQRNTHADAVGDGERSDRGNGPDIELF